MCIVCGVELSQGNHPRHARISSRRAYYHADAKTGLGDLAITESNLNRFAKQFPRYEQNEICNKFYIENFTLP